MTIKLFLIVKAFWTVWTGYLETKVKLSAEQKEAWFKLGKEFAVVANQHLQHIGLQPVANLAQMMKELEVN